MRRNDSPKHWNQLSEDERWELMIPEQIKAGFSEVQARERNTWLRADMAGKDPRVRAAFWESVRERISPDA